MKLLTIVLICLIGSTAFADDLYEQPEPTAHGFSVIFKPMSHETNVEEAAYQLLGLVDTLQSVQIAKNPKCYQEVDTPRLFGSGPHPSTGYMIGFGIVFGAVHYLVSRGIETYVDDDRPNARLIQRLWQAGSFIPRGYAVGNNASIGLGLNHSRGCVR